mgnify:CR=1 FL=1
MTEESKMYSQANKSAKIIKKLCDLYGLSISVAADIYYQSDTSELIEDGVADLQCRSDGYLASIVWDEYNEPHKRNKEFTHSCNR